MKKSIKRVLRAPLFTGWTEQYIKLALPGVVSGARLRLLVDGAEADFQYSGVCGAGGAEVMLKLGFARGECKELVFESAADGQGGATNLEPVEMSLAGGAVIGVPPYTLWVPAMGGEGVNGPFASFAGWPMASRIAGGGTFMGASLRRTNDGPLFIDYELVYQFDNNRRYSLGFRCYRSDPFVEISESFSLGLGAALSWTFNPERRLTHIISRDNFEGETQPVVEALAVERPGDVLCRLQMPVMSEYFIPNNRGWFALYDERHEAAGMVGVLGLYGDKWREPVANMPVVLVKGGAVEWQASLTSGSRHWLLYGGPLEKEFLEAAPGDEAALAAGEPRFVFHRLHAEFNALRLDAHLDLGGESIYDASCHDQAGFFGSGDFHAAAIRRAAIYPALGNAVSAATDEESIYALSLSYLVGPSPGLADKLKWVLLGQFQRWVWQFQGYRVGKHDYSKNVIGFSRYLRGMMLVYEQLRRDGALSDGEAGQLGAYFSFAARRILDEGRWPHSRTWKHPDHPDSSRDFYTYGGEHKPDRLVWSNNLPNFQSDPLCALAHLSALFKDHPDALHWRRFALQEIERQLDAYCGQSGAWEESINYACYTLLYFIITFKAVKERWGINYFGDERVRRFVHWLCRFMGPYDKRFGIHTWPGVGNARLPQSGSEVLLCYANELAADDPLRAECLALWNRTAAKVSIREHSPVAMAAMAPLDSVGAAPEPSPLHSELMDEVGVSMRDKHGATDESYLFQKIGFAKDHYEDDETAFNWYAKGVPLCMDYGTYTPDVAVGGAHNIVEIPDQDSLRRGYLAGHFFSDMLDYTHCEVPVTMKLLWGKVRTFADIDNKDGKIDKSATPYFYIGDKNPVGPKVWKVRKLLFVKPDYLLVFDRVYGEVPHRCNVHVTGDDVRRDGALLSATGRFGIDLLALVQHPPQFEAEFGEMSPHVHHDSGGDALRAAHSQRYFRLYNKSDGIYRTLLFARERGREVSLTSIGDTGIKVVTPEYTDYVFAHDEDHAVALDEVGFYGRAGWIRRHANGEVSAAVPDGEWIRAFGSTFKGMGPWSYNIDDGGFRLHGGPPRVVEVRQPGPRTSGFD